MIGLLAAVAVGTAPAAPAAPVHPGPPDTAEVARIRAELKTYLRDPKTARILVRKTGRGTVGAYGKVQTGRILCVDVSAKDSHGVYSGDRAYMFVFMANGSLGVWQHGLLRGADKVIKAQCGASVRYGPRPRFPFGL